MPRLVAVIVCVLYAALLPAADPAPSVMRRQQEMKLRALVIGHDTMGQTASALLDDMQTSAGIRIYFNRHMADTDIVKENLRGKDGIAALNSLTDLTNFTIQWQECGVWVYAYPMEMKISQESIELRAQFEADSTDPYLNEQLQELGVDVRAVELADAKAHMKLLHITDMFRFIQSTKWLQPPLLNDDLLDAELCFLEFAQERHAKLAAAARHDLEVWKAETNRAIPARLRALPDFQDDLDSRLRDLEIPVSRLPALYWNRRRLLELLIAQKGNYTIEGTALKFNSPEAQENYESCLRAIERSAKTLTREEGSITIH